MTGSFKDVSKALMLCIAVLTLASGCVSAKKGAGEHAEAAAAAEEEMVAKEETMEEEAMEEKTVVNGYTVVKNDHLWGISEQPEIYDTAYNWPLIYKANQTQIKDADLIYPGQELLIPRDSSQAVIDGAVRHAKNRGAWALGPVEATDTAYLAN